MAETIKIDRNPPPVIYMAMVEVFTSRGHAAPHAEPVLAHEWTDDAGDTWRIRLNTTDEAVDGIPARDAWLIRDGYFPDVVVATGPAPGGIVLGGYDEDELLDMVRGQVLPKGAL